MLNSYTETNFEAKKLQYKFAIQKGDLAKLVSVVQIFRNDDFSLLFKNYHLFLISFYYLLPIIINKDKYILDYRLVESHSYRFHVSFLMFLFDFLM